MSELADKLNRLRLLRDGVKAPIKSFDPDEIATKSSLQRALAIRHQAERGPQLKLTGVEVAPGLLESRQSFAPFARQSGASPKTSDKLLALHALLAKAQRPTPEALKAALDKANSKSAALEALAQLKPDWADAGVSPDQVVGFDIETSGLGAGTCIFMLGVAIFSAPIDALGRTLPKVWQTLQWTLLQPAAIGTLLQRFDATLPADAVLVSFNGRRFDLPLMLQAAQLCKLDVNWANHLHWDLLYPVRKRFKKVWPNCRLQTLEKQLLNFYRHDDLPGSAAPAAWRAYLNHGHTNPLAGILEHNRHDLITLAEALIRLCGADVNHAAG